MKCIDALLKSNNDKKVGNHKVILTDDFEKYYYHYTCICEINHKEKTITYDNGGFNTSSTTRAINCYKRSYYG